MYMYVHERMRACARVRCVIRAQIFGDPTFFWLTSSFVVKQLVNARLRAPELQGSAAVSDTTNNKTKQNKTTTKPRVAESSGNLNGRGRNLFQKR